jgi:hypothetical protein
MALSGRPSLSPDRGRGCWAGRGKRRPGRGGSWPSPLERGDRVGAGGEAQRRLLLTCEVDQRVGELRGIAALLPVHAVLRKVPAAPVDAAERARMRPQMRPTAGLAPRSGSNDRGWISAKRPLAWWTSGPSDAPKRIGPSLATSGTNHPGPGNREQLPGSVLRRQVLLGWTGAGSMLSTLTRIRPGWCRLSCRQSTIDWRTERAIWRAGARGEVAMSTLTWVSGRWVGPGRWVIVIT